MNTLVPLDGTTPVIEPAGSRFAAFEAASLARLLPSAAPGHPSVI
jgi:hypothetical protein